MSVKQAMLHDYGSREPLFIKSIKDIRNELLKICGVEKGEYEAILM